MRQRTVARGIGTALLLALAIAAPAHAHVTTFHSADVQVAAVARDPSGMAKVRFTLTVRCANADVAVGAMSIRGKLPDGSPGTFNGLFPVNLAPGVPSTNEILLAPGEYRVVWEQVGCAAAPQGDQDQDQHGDNRSQHEPFDLTIGCDGTRARPVSGGYPLLPVVEGCYARAEGQTGEPARCAPARAGFPLLPVVECPEGTVLTPAPDPPPLVGCRAVPGFPMLPVNCNGSSATPDRRGRVSQRVVCTVARCTGTVTLRTARRHRCGRGKGFPLLPVCDKVDAAASKRVLTLGKARFSIPAGKSRNVRVRLSRSHLDYLKSVRKLEVEMVLTGRSGNERIAPVTTAFTLKPR